VLTLIAEGYTNKQIADRLGISVRTVETHRERLMRKLDVQGTAALTKAAIALGLVNARG
jgi:DNA-binding CsgD family transcriptional regulator